MKLHNLLFILLILIPLTGLTQSIEEISLRFGVRINNYKINEDLGFSEKKDAGEAGFSITAQGSSLIFGSDRFSFVYGIGLQRNYINLHPLNRFYEVEGLSGLNPDTLIVKSVRNWDWQILAPIGISYLVVDQIEMGLPGFISPGLRITAGLTNEFTVKRIHTESVIREDFGAQFAFTQRSSYKDPIIQAQVDDYYSGKISKYHLRSWIGIELFSRYRMIGGCLGVTYNPVLVSPLNYKTSSPESFSVYFSLYYELYGASHKNVLSPK